MVANYMDENNGVLPYNPQAPGSLVNTGALADATGAHWSGTLRGNTNKPPVGCTGIEQTAWCPQAGATAAAKGCGGNQWLNPKLQSGGNAYSMPAYGSNVNVLSSEVTGPYAGYPTITSYKNVGVNSDLSHGAYSQNSCMNGGKRRRYRKGSTSLSRPLHKDFMTYKGSKVYDEKRLQKLIGRKTMRAPIFAYSGLGGARRRLSKKLLKKRLKYKGGADCGCGAPITPYSGGSVGNEPSVGPTMGIPPMPRNKDVENRYGVIPFNIQPKDSPFGKTVLDSADGFMKVNQVGGKHYRRKSQKKKNSKKHKSRKHYQKGGQYCQYLGNVPFSMGYGRGGINLSASESALANPAPYSPYSICNSKYPGQP
jgi:hypothetical protein